MSATMIRQIPALDGSSGSDAEPVRIAATAEIDPNANVAPGVVIWQLAQVREYAQLGTSCVIGRGAYVGPGVIIGRRCKVQNYAQILEPALIEDGVFIGPGAVLTNGMSQRAIDVDGSRMPESDRDSQGVTVRKGASIGARAVCVAPITIGQWALIEAGAVVTEDVPDFALMTGVPARRVGWVGRAGVPLVKVDSSTYECPATGDLYREESRETGEVLLPE